MGVHLLTPAMAGILRNMRRANAQPLHTMLPAQARQAYLNRAEVLEPPRAPLERVHEFSIPADDGTPLPARLYAGKNGEQPVLLYLHGGGFVVGGIETHDSLCRQFAKRSGGAVVSLEYRLAPEYRFPTAVNDAWAGLRWLAAQGHTIGADGTRLAVGGDSAGGTLAAVCALMARDAGLPLAMQLLITPGTAAHANTPSHQQFAEGFLLEGEAIGWFFDHYIDRNQRDDWRFAPLMTPDVEGVAPACVILAECDPLVDEGIAYADRLRMAGVPVTFELYRGVTHDFIKLGRALREAAHAQAFAAESLKAAWERTR